MTPLQTNPVQAGYKTIAAADPRQTLLARLARPLADGRPTD